MRLYFIFLLLILSFTTSAVTFKKGITLADIKYISTDRLSMRLSTDKEKFSALRHLCMKNLKQKNYFDYLFQDIVVVDKYLMDNYVQGNLAENKRFLKAFYKKLLTINHAFFYLIYLNDNSTLIGTLQISSERGKDELEIGFFIGSEHSGQGFATEATLAAIDFIRSVTINNSVMLDCFEENTASNQIAIKCGFHLDETRVLQKGSLNVYRQSLLN